MKKNKIKYLKDYKIPNFFIESTNLTFDLNENETIVLNESIYYKNENSKDKNDLYLDWEDLILEKIYLDDKELEKKDYTLDKVSLKIKDLPNKFKLKIVTKINPEQNKSLEWLYMSSWKFCTQCESEWFRKITYFLDRPDVLTYFKVKISADKNKFPFLLSNWNLIDSWENDDWRHFAIWEDPFKKPCYLFALVAWDFSFIEDFFITKSNRKVKLRIFSYHNNINRCNFAMESLKKSMKWDEDRFWLEYDLDIFMIVWVDNFNSWAMENKWLNIFNSNYLLASPETSTDTDYKYVEKVIWHEYFHNWTWDRVTCRDWFQLSLKEWLTVYRDAEFTYDMHFRDIERIDDVKYLRENQFLEDSWPLSHPIRPSYYEEIDNFYTLTVYEKWAEVIRMYNTILWEKWFQKWMKLYFDRHDWQAVTTEDFLKAMSDANNYDFSKFQTWYDQAWTPVVDIESEYFEESKKLLIRFRQSCRQTEETKEKKPFVIPIKLWLIKKEWWEFNVWQELFILDKKEDFIEYDNIDSNPTISLFRWFSAPVKYNYNYTRQDYINLIKSDSDNFNKYEAFQKFSQEIILWIIISWETKIDQSYIKLIWDILENKEIDNSFKAELMSLPSIKEIWNIIWENIDYEKIYKSLVYVEKIISKLYISNFTNIYNDLYIEKEYDFNSKDIWNRKLKNICLKYISLFDWPEIAYLQYKKSNNMTDMMWALECLNDINCDQRKLAFEDFYNKYKDDNITINKWFKLEATSFLPDTLENIKNITNLEVFDIKKPNNVYSLLRSFAWLNPVLFNKKDWSWYEYIMDKVLEIDRFNPMVAWRIAKYLTNWKSLEKSSWKVLKKVLIKMSNYEELSIWLKEVINKSLSEG